MLKKQKPEAKQVKKYATQQPSWFQAEIHGRLRLQIAEGSLEPRLMLRGSRVRDLT